MLTGLYAAHSAHGSPRVPRGPRVNIFLVAEPELHHRVRMAKCEREICESSALVAGAHAHRFVIELLFQLA